MADIVIGTSLPQTGPYAETQFLQYSRAYDLWVRDVNAAGGMLGRPVRLLWYDDHGQADQCRENFQRLIHDDKVDLLLGPCHSILIEPMAHITEEAEMLLLEGSGSVSEMFRQGRKWLFLCWDADCNYMKSFLEFMSSPANPKRVSKVGSVAGNRPRGLGHARGVRDHSARMGLEVAFDELISGTPDYADIFRRRRRRALKRSCGTSKRGVKTRKLRSPLRSPQGSPPPNSGCRKALVKKWRMGSLAA